MISNNEYIGNRAIVQLQLFICFALLSWKRIDEKLIIFLPNK